MKRVLLPIFVVVAAVALAGCATSPFYNEARDKQGQALKEATAKIDLITVVDELDQRFAAMRVLELKTMRTRAATQRQMEVSMVTSPGPEGDGTLETRYVRPLLDDRIERLVGRKLDARQLDGVLTGVVDDEHADAGVARALRSFNATAGLKLGDCAGARGATDEGGALRPEVRLKVEATKRGAAQALMKDLLAKCQAAAQAQPVSGEAGGELQRLAGLQAKAAATAATYHSSVVAHRKSLAAAAAAYQQEVEAAAPRTGDATAMARLANAAATMQSAIGALRQGASLSPDAFGHAEALERLESLDAVVGALASGSADLSSLDDKQKRAVGIVQLIPAVADDVEALLTRARKPRLAPLLLALEQQRLLVQGYEAKAALLDRHAQLRQQQLDAARGELRALAQARRALGPPAQGQKGATVTLSVSLADAAADTAESSRRQVALYESLAIYFDTALHRRAQTHELELAHSGTTDEMVMLQSRTAAAQWSSLMKNMAAVIAEYHAEGIKPGELAEFLKGFGLIVVGARVGN